MQPGTGRSPVALHGRGRDPHHLRGFLQRKAGKESQLHYAALPRIDLSKGIEGIVDRDDVHIFILALGQGHGVVQCEHADTAATFGGATAASVVHQDLAHKLGCDCEKMGATLPLRGFLPKQPEISLMH